MQQNAFQEGFLKVQCLKAWAKMGATPMKRACLSDKQVCRTIGDTDNEPNLVMREINNANAATTFTLSMLSYRGDLLSARCIEETLEWPISIGQYLEPLDLVEKAYSNGTKFFATVAI